MVPKQGRGFLQTLQIKGVTVEFNELAETLREGYEANGVYIIDASGRLLGFSEREPRPTSFDAAWLKQRRFPPELNQAVLKLGAVVCGEEVRSLLPLPNGLVAPIIGGGVRVGTLIVARESPAFGNEDVDAAEIAATCIGVVIEYDISERREDDAAEREEARSAVSNLSYSEIRAVKRILGELDGMEGVLVASKVADVAGITRSVIVNALRKLASANVIESRSLGMKGTYLRVTNRYLSEELARQPVPVETGSNGTGEDQAVDF